MAVSSDTLRLGTVREVTPGVIPANPAFQIARITGEGLAYNPTTALSNELNPARQVTDVIVSGGSSGGDVSFEISRNVWLEEMMSAALGSEWGLTTADQLEVGSILKTYTFEKTFTVDPVDPGIYDYHRIVRAIVDSMQLTFTPGGPDTGSIAILGGQYTREELPLAGATYLPANQSPVMVGSGVIPITVTIEGVPYEGWCFSNITVNFRNNGRAIECLGSVGASEMVIGRFECEISTQVYVVDETHQVMDAFLENTEIGFAFSINDSVGNVYAFDFPRCRVQAATQVAGGTNTDVILNATLQALVDDIGAGVMSCVAITRAPAVPLGREGEAFTAEPLTPEEANIVQPSLGQPDEPTKDESVLVETST